VKSLSIPVSLILRFYLKRYGAKNKPVKFENIFINAKKYLFLLPEDSTQIKAIYPLIQHLDASGKQIILLFHSRVGNSVQGLRKFHIEEYFDNDFNGFGFPKMKFKERLNQLGVDMLIACNTQYDLQYLVLAATVKAGVKCGIRGPYSDMVFQLQFAPDNGGNIAIFSTIVQYTGIV
jgi:hypothetical protein